MQVPRKPRCIITIVAAQRGKCEFVFRVQVKPFLCGVTWHVRKEESNRKKKRFPRLLIQLLDSPTCDLPISFILVAMWEHAPIDQRMRRRTQAASPVSSLVHLTGAGQHELDSARRQ